MRVTEGAAPACLSRLRCDQLINGELDASDPQVMHAAACERCSARLAEHRRERARFAVPLPAPRSAPRRIRLGAGLATALAAMAAIWLVGVRDRGASGTRTKGKPAIGFYVKHGEAIRRGGAGEIVAPRDALNFSASSDRAAFLTIVSIDGAGAVSVYYPEGALAAPIAAGRDHVLPLSVALDDVLGVERLHGVFCDRPIAVAALAAAVAGGVSLPAGCVADTLTIEKRAR